MKLDQERLKRLYPDMEESFALRMEELVRGLPLQKEEKRVKRLALSTVLVWALLTALLCATAYAVITYGLDWYYSNRLTAYQEHEPEKYAAIMEHMQSDLLQTVEGCASVDIQVAEASWAEEENVLVVSLRARPAEPAVYELHPMWNLDPDGAYMGKTFVPDPSGDSEERNVHWLWTEEGFGPVEERIAPGKQLLLLDTGDVLLDGQPLFGDGSSMDSFVGKDGAVYTVLEVRLEEHSLCRQAILEDEDGVLRLSVAFRVTPFTEDDEALYLGGEEGFVHFELKIR